MQYRLISEEELYHYGVKGQKWGVRRYQNKDGSLTIREVVDIMLQLTDGLSAAHDSYIIGLNISMLCRIHIHHSLL